MHLKDYKLSEELIPYRKPYKAGLEFCTKLSSNNLQIDNPEEYALILERISYYRFKAYPFPFQDKTVDFMTASIFKIVINYIVLTKSYVNLYFNRFNI